LRTVQQNVFLILNSVPVTSVTDPELIRPSISVMTHSLDQKVVARKAKARKCAAEVDGNVQAKVERKHKGYKGYKDGLHPETLADGNWLVKQNQPVSKIETKSDTNLRSLYES